MRMTRILAPTLRENPGDADGPGQKLMLRAGLIRSVAPGAYGLLPLGLRVVEKITSIIRHELGRLGAQAIRVPVLLPADSLAGTTCHASDSLLNDQRGTRYILTPGRHEAISLLAGREIRSYRQLPLMLYHVTDSIKAEPRPRAGCTRMRQSVTKELYSFDMDEASLGASYCAVYEAYVRLFNQCDLSTRIVSCGAAPAEESHEFIAPAPGGDYDVLACAACGYALGAEHAEAAPRTFAAEDMKPLKEVSTPGVHTISELVAHLGVPANKTSKILFHWASMSDGREQMVASLVMGDRELSEAKLAKAVGAARVVMAPSTDVHRVTGAPVGSAGPVGLPVACIVMDREVSVSNNLVMGANREGYHLMNVNPERDFKASLVADIALATEGSRCPRCPGTLMSEQGIRVAHLRMLGTKPSSVPGTRFTDEAGEPRPLAVGYYSIDIAQTARAIAEQSHDTDGIVWPVAVAPYHAAIMCINPKDEAQCALAESLYTTLASQAVDVVLDDRPERAGVKFKDLDLIGFPYRINVGRKTADGIIELFERRSKSLVEMDSASATQHIVASVKRLAAGNQHHEQ